MSLSSKITALWHLIMALVCMFCALMAKGVPTQAFGWFGVAFCGSMALLEVTREH